MFAEITVTYKGGIYYALLPLIDSPEDMHLNDEDVLTVRSKGPTIKTVWIMYTQSPHRAT